MKYHWSVGHKLRDEIRYHLFSVHDTYYCNTQLWHIRSHRFTCIQKNWVIPACVLAVDIVTCNCRSSSGCCIDSCLQWNTSSSGHWCPGIQASEANGGELAAFVAYACAFPAKFLCLVDTYDVIRYVTCLLLLLTYQGFDGITAGQSGTHRHSRAARKQLMVNNGNT